MTFRILSLVAAFIVGFGVAFLLYPKIKGEPHGVMLYVLNVVSSVDEDTSAYDREPKGPKVHCTIYLRLTNRTNLALGIKSLSLSPSVRDTAILLPPFTINEDQLPPWYSQDTSASISLDRKICDSLR